jgi:hypothetical protein
MTLFEVALIIYVFNIPFGYWRANVKKLSIQWALAIHIPVPVVIALRFWAGIGFAFITYPILVGAFFGGQFTGSKISHMLKKNPEFTVTSSLFSDIIRFIRDTNKK